MKQDEQRDMTPLDRRADHRSGYIIPLILVVGIIGVLFGFGRLMMFRYQAQIRLDRQAELDKTLATRSALNWLSELRDAEFPGGLKPHPDADDYEQFVYTAQSGVYTLRVQAVPPVYTSNWAATSWYDASTGEGKVAADELTIGPTTNDVAAIWWPLEAGETWLNPEAAPFGRRYWVKPRQVIFPGAGIAQDGAELTPGVYDFVISLYLLGTNSYPIGTAHPSDLPHWVRVELDYAAAQLRAGWSGAPMWDTLSWTEVAHGFGVQLSQQSGMLLEWAFEEGVRLRRSIPAFPAEESQFPSITLYLEARLLNDLEADEVANITFEHVTVSPSFEFEVELSWAKGTDVFREIATYVNVRPDFGEEGVIWNTYSYDTHGVSRMLEPLGD